MSAREGVGVKAVLEDGPLKGRTMDVSRIEGRPPSTIDVEEDAQTYRYCLAEWSQEGPTAAYTFLYTV